MAKRYETIQWRKYAVLRFMSNALYVMGALAIIAGIVMFVVATDSRNGGGGIQVTIAIVSLVGGIVTGIMMFIQAQLLDLFVDLEWNQREMIDLQKQVIDNMPDKVKE